MHSHRSKRSVGIKELKDRASEIVAFVQRTGQGISITRNGEEVARIMPASADAHERLIAAGLVQPGPKPPLLSDLKLKRLAPDASRAINAILRDRTDK